MSAEAEKLRDQAWKTLVDLPSLTERGGQPLGFFRRRQLNKATLAITRAVELCPEDPVCLWGHGRALHLGGELEAAAALLERALALLPTQGELLLEASQICMALGQGQRAEQLGRQALELDASNIDVMLHYALTLVVTQQAKRALGVATNACKLDPNRADTWTTLEWIQKLAKGEGQCPTRLGPADRAG